MMKNNVNKNGSAMKKLIPAAGMLAVSAMMLATSTYAWFSMSTKVSATNIEMKATASKNLLISKTGANADDYAASVDLAISNTALVPVSTIGGNTRTPAFYKIQSVGTGMSQDSAARGANTTLTNATANTDYVKSTVWIKCVGENTSDLKATINTTTGGEKDLDPAIRVMIVDSTSGKTYIYSPITGAAYLTPGQAINGVDAANGGTLGSITTAATSGSTIITATLEKDTAYQYDIYAWYEGEDVNCKASNTLDMAAYKFAIDFTVT
jgi:hypothetical protein